MLSKRNIAFTVLCLFMALCFLCACTNEESFSSAESEESIFSEEKSEAFSSEESLSAEELSETVSQLYETPEDYVRYGLADSVEKVTESVVSIKVTSSYKGGFYGQYTVEENGSGVIISDSGYILTNCHVVEDAENITVVLSDNSEHTASIIGKDAKTDLAVIKIETEGKLAYAAFADSTTLRLGDFVFAIGNALGKYPGSVTMGIISSLSRDVTVNGETMKMIQTDAALNSGNSGGGLFDSEGYLVGIVSAKDADSESEGVGFVIPSDVAISVANDIITYGYVTGRPTLGFETVDITSMREASYYGVDWIGVYISNVESGSYGETAGLKARDYVYSVNGEVITTTDRLEEILDGCAIGDTLFLEIWRGNNSIDVILMIGEEVN